MQKIEILALGKHPEIMRTILRLINNKPEWNGSAAFTVDEAIALSHKTAFNMVLLGAGFNEDESRQLHQYFSVPLVQHYGGGSGLLYAEVYQALNR
jgi:hypothetical protein